MLRMAPEAKAESVSQREQPGNGATSVGTGVAPEAMEGLTSSHPWIDWATIRRYWLLVRMWQLPAPQGEAQGVARAIRERDAQRKGHRTPCNRVKRTDGAQTCRGSWSKG